MVLTCLVRQVNLKINNFVLKICLAFPTLHLQMSRGNNSHRSTLVRGSDVLPEKEVIDNVPYLIISHLCTCLSYQIFGWC